MCEKTVETIRSIPGKSFETIRSIRVSLYNYLFAACMPLGATPPRSAGVTTPTEFVRARSHEAWPEAALGGIAGLGANPLGKSGNAGYAVS